MPGRPPGPSPHLEPLDSPAQVGIERTDQKVVVVVHADEGVDLDPEAPGQFGEPTEEPAAAVAGADDAFAAVAAVDDVVPPAGNEHATRPGPAGCFTGLDLM
jgi:hypothetical protein